MEVDSSGVVLLTMNSSWIKIFASCTQNSECFTETTDCQKKSHLFSAENVVFKCRQKFVSIFDFLDSRS
jgi:hypothetical protein